ncbi:probable cytochrome P450 49a1 [Ischnura elegans]|uniref:probable cytochrome P450 49a1 n=1 Tax=Ischnura elegans TaxID=197161 RepID=UPI001ED87996|nr:probable cytochrome P450 49a1 [Ischnura elegans]
MSGRKTVACLITRCSGIASIHRNVIQEKSKQALRRLHTTTKRLSAVASALNTEDVKPYEEIPGPRAFPVIGCAWAFLPYVGEFHGKGAMEMHRDTYNKYGPIAKFKGFPGRPDMVVIFCPEDVEKAFRNEGPWPIRGGNQGMQYYRNVVRRDFYQDKVGVLAENGPKWAEARSKVNPPMMQPRIASQYVEPIGGVAQEFIERIRSIKDEKEEMPKDFVNDLFKWSLESIAYVALDTRLGCLESNLPPDSEPQKMIDAVGDFFDCFFDIEVNIPFWKIYPTSTWKRYVRALDTFLEVSSKHVKAAMERSERRKAGGGTQAGAEMSVLERLLARTDMREATIMAQDMMFGGIDTTSYTIAATLYLMTKNPEKQELLFKELKKYLPSKNDVITDEKLKEMKYLKACLKESHRVLPILSGNLRGAVKDLVLSNYRVPKGTNIVMPSVISLNSEEIFPMSKRYIPERWLKNRPTEESTGSKEDFDSVHATKRHPFAFLPFGFGPRSCIGKRFAELETEILLAKIVRNFRVEYSYGELTFTNKILTIPTQPLHFKMAERKD